MLQTDATDVGREAAVLFLGAAFLIYDATVYGNDQMEYSGAQMGLGGEVESDYTGRVGLGGAAYTYNN